MKVYAVIVEYDPYVNYSDIESRAELSIAGVFKSKQKAVDIRNDLAREEAKECNVKIDAKDYKDPEKHLNVLSTEYYIQEFDVE